MAKDKKGRTEGKKARIAEKKQKQEKKGEKREKTKKAKGAADDSDAEDVDIDAVLAEYARKQEQFLKVSESPCEPPKARASSTFIPSPANDNELFLFGGEYFNGAIATFFNDLYVYLINRDEWHLVTSPNTPLPRSGHAWCRGGNAGGIYLFGGEFSSPKQGTFYHYNDFWRLEPATREWTRIETKGKAPPARSGHRMTYYKNYIILFGGFQDTSQQTKYLADLWVYDTQNFVWHNPTLPPATQKPDARSSFNFLPHDAGAVLYGGYSRVKSVVTSNKTKGGGQSQRNVLKPMVHQDCFFLRVVQPATDAGVNAPPVVRWERRKKPANAPNPPRAGATMAYHRGRGISFGGVHDVEESEEGIDSEFFSTLYAWNIERNRYFPLTLRRPRAQKKGVAANERGGRRGRAQANEEELLRNLAALSTGKSLADAESMEIERPVDEPEEEMAAAKEVLMEFPHPRFNAQLAVQNDVLYIYGGTFERGDREFTFDEMFAVDLGKLEGVTQIYRRELENWLGGEDDEDDSEDDEDDEDGSWDELEDVADDDEMDLDEEEIEARAKLKPAERLHSESTRKPGRRGAKTTQPDVGGGVEPIGEPVDPAMPFDDTPDNAATGETSRTAEEDNQPMPRVFETRRDFFARTGAAWQELLLSKMSSRSAGTAPLAIKELKTRAFDMCEARWWDVREEITGLEDEQMQAGIGEVVAFAERGGGNGNGDGGGGGGRRR